MFCLYTLPLARPAQAKIQMLTAICSIVKLIPWNLVNLSHLYIIKFIIKWFEEKCFTMSTVAFSSQRLKLCKNSLEIVKISNYNATSWIFWFQCGTYLYIECVSSMRFCGEKIKPLSLGYSSIWDKSITVHSNI